MNKNFRVITINGIRGMIVLVFLIMGLIAGFIISPGWVCMKFWNYLFEDSSTIALMNIYQGIMLWAAIVLSLYALNNKKALIGFGSFQGLSPEQIKDIMQQAKDSDFDNIQMIEKLKKNLNNLSIEENPDKTSETNKSEENAGKAGK